MTKKIPEVDSRVLVLRSGQAGTVVEVHGSTLTVRVDGEPGLVVGPARAFRPL